MLTTLNMHMNCSVQQNRTERNSKNKFILCGFHHTEMIKDLDRHKTINEMHEKLNGVRSKWATKYGIIIDKPPQLTIVAVVEINKFKVCRNIAQFSLSHSFDVFFLSNFGAFHRPAIGYMFHAFLIISGRFFHTLGPYTKWKLLNNANSSLNMIYCDSSMQVNWSLFIRRLRP